jgi:hypothetical protein
LEGRVEEEGNIPLSSSSIWCCGCVCDEVDLRYCFIIITYVWLKLCGRRCQSVSVTSTPHMLRAVCVLELLLTLVGLLQQLLGMLAAVLFMGR